MAVPVVTMHDVVAVAMMTMTMSVAMPVTDVVRMAVTMAMPVTVPVRTGVSMRCGEGQTDDGDGSQQETLHVSLLASFLSWVGGPGVLPPGTSGLKGTDRAKSSYSAARKFLSHLKINTYK